MPSLYLVDGNAYVHRSFHALPPLTTSRGEPVNAVYGFTRFLLRLIKDRAPDYCAVCFDHPTPTFRHKAFPAYKAHRKELDNDLRSQMPRAREAAAALALPCVEVPGFEADDLIATLARQAARDGVDVFVVTGDKDALQLVTDRISVYNESKNIVFDRAMVLSRYGLPPERLTDFFALTGDASDNIPGVPGVGEKTALKLLQAYGTLDALLARRQELTGRNRDLFAAYADQAVLSRQLATVCDTAPVAVTWQECQLRSPDPRSLAAFLTRYEFSGLMAELLPGGAPTPKEDFFDLLS